MVRVQLPDSTLAVTLNLNFANKDAVILKDIAAIWKSLEHA